MCWAGRRAWRRRRSVSGPEGGLGSTLVLVPRKPPVLHGRGGLSRKGPAEGQASYYSS